MRCISPLRLRKSGEWVVVPCGKCNFCLMSRRADWTFRLFQEFKVCSVACFATFTYCDELMPEGMEVRKDHFQDFMKRLRKAVSPVKLRFYAVGEYGSKTFRPHYHALLFNVPAAVRSDLEKIWSFGSVHVGSVSMASIHYVTKYHVNKYGECGDRAPPFATMSRRPGIGSNYLVTHKSFHRRGMLNYAQVNGVISRLPRFYKERMFSSIERARFALESVDIDTVQYQEAIEGLKAFHPDPEAYYYERLVFLHENAKHKSNKLDTF